MSKITPVDERQPLLSPAPLVTGEDVEHDEENIEVPVAEDVPKKRSWWSIGWYTLLTVFGILFAVIFIKGFIDADDVEVSVYRWEINVKELTSPLSSILVRL